MRACLLLAWPLVAVVLLVVGVASYVEILTRPVADPCDDGDDFDGPPVRPGGDVSGMGSSRASATSAASVSTPLPVEGVPAGSLHA